jgi:DNA replication licensing factor MCM2
VVRDVADPVQDQRLATFVVGSHAASHPDDAAAAAAAAGEAEEGVAGTSGGGPDGILPQDLLRKYITYAKQTCNPVFGEVRFALGLCGPWVCN